MDGGQYEATDFKSRTDLGASTWEMYQNVLEYLRKCNGVCIDDHKIECGKKYVLPL